MHWPDEQDACPFMPTRYCDWDCSTGCFRFPWHSTENLRNGAELAVLLIDAGGDTGRGAATEHRGDSGGRRGLRPGSEDDDSGDQPAGDQRADGQRGGA